MNLDSILGTVPTGCTRIPNTALIIWTETENTMQRITLSAVRFQKGCFLLEKFNKVGIIGTGKAASALLQHFKSHQIGISGVWGRNEENAKKLSQFFKVENYRTKMELVANSSIIILAVKDGSIKTVASEIAEELFAGSAPESPFSFDFSASDIEKKTFVHLSGALSASELDPLSNRGAKVLSAHIIQTLSTSNYLSSHDILENVWFSLQGDGAAIDTFRELLRKCNNENFIIPAEDKPLYHSAMCVFSNYLVTLVGQGLKLFNPSGTDFPNAFDVISPLINGTLENIRVSGPEAALTGPILRGDSVTIERHLSAIKEKLPDSLGFYSLMGIETLKLVNDENKNRAIEDMLNKELNETFKEKVKK